MKIAFDIRSNYKAGVFRYGVSLASGVLKLAPQVRHQITVICEQDRYDALKNQFSNIPGWSEANLYVAPGDDRYVRNNPELRKWLAAEGFDLYYSSNYAIDPQTPIPFVFIIHDLIP